MDDCGRTECCRSRCRYTPTPSRPISRLTGCVCTAVVEVTRETFKCLLSPQHPPHLISSLKGMCGSIAAFVAPYSSAHTHTQIRQQGQAHTHAWSSAAGHLRQAVDHQSVDRSSLAQPIQDAGGGLCSCVCVCVCLWDEILCVCLIHLSRAWLPISSRPLVIHANNGTPTWAGWPTDNPEVKQLFNPHVTWYETRRNMLLVYLFDL